MKKMWAALLLTAVIIMTAGVCAIAGTFDGYWDSQQDDQTEFLTTGDYDYLINNMEAAIVKYTGDADKVTIPSEINGCLVTEIGAEAFRYRKLKKVSVPGSIRRIGKQAFEYCEITDSLQLPENVFWIPDIC